MNTKSQTTKPASRQKSPPLKASSQRASAQSASPAKKSRPVSTPKRLVKHPAPKPPLAPPPSGTKPSKQSLLIELLRSASGGTVQQMSALTGWQAHTVRGTISGVLRKRLGLTVQCSLGPDLQSRIYRIVDAAAA